MEKITEYPIPIGIMLVRDDISGKEKNPEKIRESVEYSLTHIEEALDYAMKYSRGNARNTVRNFVLKYVNGKTLDMSDDRRESINFLLQRAIENGLSSKNVRLKFL